MSRLLAWVLALVFVWIVNNQIHHFIDPYILSIVIFAGINIIFATSLNLISGFTGQFSMGHAGFMAIGAYVSALLSTSFFASFPQLFFVVIFLSGCIAAVFGYIVALPSLRLRGDYLAIVTLGFGEIIRVIILNINSLGGARGMTDIPPLSSFGWVYTGVVAALFMLWRLTRSSQGRAFLAVREDEIAASSMGVPTTHVKLQAFVIGAFLAGVAGSLFAHYLSYLNPQTFDLNKSFEAIIMVVLGGMGSISGSVIAAVFLTVIRELLRPLQDMIGIDLRMILYSLLLILVMILRPKGLLGTKEWIDFVPRWPKKVLRQRRPLHEG
ncbi:MAG: branched-chain amino acid ABC transporter permease [Deltaproteobacteria bacterium]|nr:branched-chain amino acid ABC transporter permease [Deltaproteobacteria bacterium]